MLRVRAIGLDGFRADLEVAEDRLRSGVDKLMTELASDAAREARENALRGQLTGRARASIRPMGPTVRAGDDVPWYGFADFGGTVGRKRSVKRDYIKGGRWLFPAVRDLGVMKRADAMVDKALKDVT